MSPPSHVVMNTAWLLWVQAREGGGGEILGGENDQLVFKNYCISTVLF